MLLYLLRHGRTDYNDQGLVQGQLDIPLNNHGRTQIEKLAKHCRLVPFNRIYTSNLSRAVESAEIIAKHPAHGDLIISHELRDRHYGSLQGEIWDGDTIPEDAESQQSLTARLQEWLSTLLINHTPPTSLSNSPKTPIPADVVLVVTHEECLLTLLDILTSSSPGVQTRRGVDVDVDVAHGVDTATRVDNGRLCIVRIWWDVEGVRGRIEGWGVGGLLQDD